MNTWEQPQLHLAKPQKDYYSVLRGVKNFNSKLYLNNICNISFRVYEYENGERNELYSELEETQLIQALDYEVEWFQITTVSERKDDVPVAYKDISCNSLEDELITKTIHDINGVFPLYDIKNPSKSLMHIITNNISWNIGYISPHLSTLYRTLSIDSSRIYSLLTGELSKSFDCIFKFNREYKTISAYTLDEIGELTDIVISEDNLLKSWEKNSNKDKIVTRMKVTGGVSTDGILFDIRKVNFGSDSITNYDYFKPRMSIELQTALNNWETAIDTYTSSYNTNIDLLKLYNSELNTLNNDITEIKSQISALEEVLNASLKMHHGYPPSSKDSDYTNYRNALTQISTLNKQKANKQVEINNKKNQINIIDNNLDNISSNVDKSNFFTLDLLKELDCFTYDGDDYVDDTFISTSETTSSEEIEMALQLKANAEKELHIACRPQPEFKATLKNLWSLYDEKDCVISYDEYRNKFKLGNLVTVILNDNSWTTIRIIGIELDYNNRENAEITFSSRTRLDNSTYNLSEIQAQASRAYSAITMNKYSWNSAASQTSSNESFRTGVLNATLNRMVSDDNAQVETGSFGIKLRPWIEGENKYGLNQMWLNPYRMLFTNDGWETASSAFGLLDLLDGTQGMGINTEYLMGRFIISENLLISNSAGTYTIDDDGFTATATVGSNIYSTGINPSTPSEIFYIKVNGINKLYVDTITNQLVMDGKITSTSGSIGGWSIGLNTLTSYGDATINILNGNNDAMTLSYNGLKLYNPRVSGEHYGSISSVYDSVTKHGGIVISQGLNAKLFAIGHNTASDAYNIDMVFSNSGGSISTLGSFSSGFTFFRSVNVKANLSVQGKSVIHSGNIGSQSVSYASTAGYADVAGSISGGLMSSDIISSDTGYGNIDLQGNEAASTDWVQANYVPIGASDVRLKYDIHSLYDIPDELFFNLKPKRFKYKTDTYGKGINFGLIAQEVESAFLSQGLNPYDFNIIDIKDVRKYSDDGYYVSDETHRINYQNLISWTVSIVQKQQKKIIELEAKVNDLINK